MTNTFRRGDDSRAFEGHLLKINRPPSSGDSVKISKIDFICNDVVIPYKNPEFPLYVDLTPSQSRRLKHETRCYLIAYDDKNRPSTCVGYLTICGLNEVKSCQKC